MDTMASFLRHVSVVDLEWHKKKLLAKITLQLSCVSVFIMPLVFMIMCECYDFRSVYVRRIINQLLIPINCIKIRTKLKSFRGIHAFLVQVIAIINVVRVFENQDTSEYIYIYTLSSYIESF